ncbi:MAG: TonB-dependent receptor [Crocinitomicaceae bacterium]|jgi:hypothetical protein|nr:TonB-dependent receptor [Crocinitomicaceae bacterium]
MKILMITSAWLCLAFNSAVGQSTQTVRGTVTDKISQAPISGAKIILVDSSPVLGAVSDPDGNFRLENVPVGRQSIKITYSGYKEISLDNVFVNAGKELVLQVQLEEEFRKLEEVSVKAQVEKNKPLNEMSAVSTRTFSVEETQKFAAAVNDPARMATSFAGVVTAGDGNNHISIRGNSPNGLLWRMEGVEIPNPNHFSNVGTAGGGISILSSQLLGNSDFSTGAFAAEYGNALSGVFDLRLRKGNNQKREYTLQLGFLGADLSAEGPFKKGYDGSYLINYRYSTLNILGRMGVPIGDANTNFQDLSFNIYLPTAKMGKFSLFGFGGLSYQTTEAEKDSLRWKEDDFLRYNTWFSSNTGAVGATHTYLFKNRSYLKTALVFSATENGYHEERFLSDYVHLDSTYYQLFGQQKITLSSTYTQKISSKTNFRTGFILNRPGYKLQQKQQNDAGQFEEFINVKGNTETVQAFFQLNHKWTPKLSTNAGLHYYQLLLNKSYSVEPRASVKYEFSTKHDLSLGYGLHSQLQPIGVYFAQATDSSGVVSFPNRDLKLSRAHHLVLAYDIKLNMYSHIKTELYYQHLFDVPISADTSNTFSMLNLLDGYYTGELVNKGQGKNYGLELTYERFLHKNLYYLLSASVYESKYQASNGKWYDTRFNTNYAASLTLGKDWHLQKRKNRVVGINIKTIYTGGFRYTPIDLEASLLAGETRFKTNETFGKQIPAYFRLDIRASLKRNYEKVTTTLALDIQNTTNRKNVGGQYFDSKTGEVKYWYQTSLIPVLSYRVEF